MALTTAQLATLKADILASPDMSGQPMTSGGAYAIATLYNVPGATDVWRTDAPVSAIYDAITWTNFTPVDAADNTATFTNRALVIQTKQMNLQNILQGRTTVDGSKANLRAGLRDAVIQLPAGAAGALVVAGGASGATVMTALVRKATRFEALFASAPVATGTVSAGLMAVEGAVTSDTVQQARES